MVCDGNVCRPVDAKAAAPTTEAPAPDESALPEVFRLMGTSLRGKGGAEVPVSSITGPNKVVGLYFSALCCPPWPGFLPELDALTATYSRFKAEHPRAADWEVVFVSCDADAESFAEHHAEMPWPALPYESREAKVALSRMFKVIRTPHLVILDGETGEVITTSGRSVVGGDVASRCAKFPWRPRTLQQIMAGVPLVPAPGSAAPVPDAAEALKGKTTLLYFSASWCGPCASFTPKLVAAVERLRARGEAFEVVFVSADSDGEEFATCHAKMSWPALGPETNKGTIRELNVRYNVDRVPMLVVLDPQGALLSADATGDLCEDPRCARFPWATRALAPLSTSSVGAALHEGKLLLLLAEEQDEAAVEAWAEAVLGSVAASTKAGPTGYEWAFVWGRRTHQLAGQLLTWVGLQEEQEEAGEGSDEDEGAGMDGEASKAEAGGTTGEAGGAKPAGAKAPGPLPTGPLLVLADVPGARRAWLLSGRYELSPGGMAALVADCEAGRLGPGSRLGRDLDGGQEEDA